MNLSRGSKIFLVLLLLAVGGGLGTLRWASSQLDARDGVESTPVTFEVELGVGRRELADQLEAAGIVRSAGSFDLFARTDGFFTTLDAGTYELMTNMSAADVADVLRAGPVVADESQFRVEEGLSQVLTLERIAEQFENISVADLQAVLDARLEAGENAPGVLRLPEGLPDPSTLGPEVQFPFEGLIFPETYRVEVGSSPQAILQRAVDQLASVLDVVSEDELIALAERDLSLYDAMVIASLVERETRVDSERAVVASVIYNRLDIDMRLQIDATVLYALGQWKERVLTADTTIDSPYNTYGVVGLPPTPISGFGVASLRAALNPDETSFTYYVLTPACDGQHTFASSLAEHNANVAEFRAAGNCL